jgi:hypothetical protein
MATIDLDALDDGDETTELITLQRCDVDEIAYLLARLEDFLLHDDDHTAHHVSQFLINDSHDGSHAGSAHSPVTCAASRSQSARTSALDERRSIDLVGAPEHRTCPRTRHATSGLKCHQTMLLGAVKGERLVG